MSRPTWVVVVARTGPTAKSRLAGVLDPEERTELALAMLTDVLATCRAADVDGVVAVVSSAEGRALAEQLGVTALTDDGGDMNRAAAAGLEAAVARGAEAALVLPGDVPLVGHDDLVAMKLAGAGGPSLVVAPDSVGAGTNGLLLSPPSTQALAFEGASAERHLRRARELGMRAIRLTLPGLELDVDTPEDLARLRTFDPGGRTGRLLARLYGSQPAGRLAP